MEFLVVRVGRVGPTAVSVKGSRALVARLMLKGSGQWCTVVLACNMVLHSRKSCQMWISRSYGELIKLSLHVPVPLPMLFEEAAFRSVIQMIHPKRGSHTMSDGTFHMLDFYLFYKRSTRVAQPLQSPGLVGVWQNQNKGSLGTQRGKWGLQGAVPHKAVVAKVKAICINFQLAT